MSRTVQKLELQLTVPRQPDLATCGPTCLHAVYRFFNDPIPLRQVIDEVSSLEGGGTLGVLLGCHALERGYGAVLYTYNLRIFDPTWFRMARKELMDRLSKRIQARDGKKLRVASEAYLHFLDMGGEVRMEDLSPALILGQLEAGRPILTGLSATYLYQSARESGVHDDDIRGDAQGHFVVLTGYDEIRGRILVADPLGGTEWVENSVYSVTIGRLITAILLGVLTYDANLLFLTPAGEAG